MNLIDYIELTLLIITVLVLAIALMGKEDMQSGQRLLHAMLQLPDKQKHSGYD